MTEPSLPEKVLAIEQAMSAIPHAFGGALSLAYWAEPRATADIDLNVFVAVDQADEVLDLLAALGVAPDDAARLIRRDGQARVMWGRTPVDLFFAYDPFHRAAERAAVVVPFASSTIPVLSADHLTVCKVVFDRTKDWVDIEAMRTLGTRLDAAEILRWVGRIAGDTDPRYDRIAALLTST